MKKSFLILALISPCFAYSQYTGTASITQGPASTTSGNLYPCNGGRIASLGSIKASDNSIWTVPAEVNFTNTTFPFASDLYNSCNGKIYTTSASALAALNGSDIINIDDEGELITGYIFSDNYFELYINGIAVGKDNVPYTQFNSNIVRFKVKKPFTIAMLLVDWEENLGLGSENNNGFKYHPGDGGMVAVFKDEKGNIIAKTGSDWEAQTFYTAPISDLNCPNEIGHIRYSDKCSVLGTNTGNNYYGLHWKKPSNWMFPSVDDSAWPSASIFSNASVGVDNKLAYTNFKNIFDDPLNDAEFIWSTNLILDNEVVVRYKVDINSGLDKFNDNLKNIEIYPNPAKDEFNILLGEGLNPSEVKKLSLYNLLGEKVFEIDHYQSKIPLKTIQNGLYTLNIELPYQQITKKIIVQ